MKIQILGTGCAKCRKLCEAVGEAAKGMNLDYSISKVESLKEIAAMGAAMTPAIAIDGRVIHSGSIPSPDRLRELLGG